MRLTQKQKDQIEYLSAEGAFSDIDESLVQLACLVAKLIEHTDDLEDRIEQLESGL